ncbi:MAG TPA: RNA 2',3'-cyclic phosphodiesterase [Pyrinomonadaceae bacterium]|nr:RNA 2',3'-cyclic phosphodiesterase [Pyrinomonadaceae bacterium]
MDTSTTDESQKAAWRIFYAFELTETLRARIQEHIQNLRDAVPEAAASWSRPENIHLTVKFFGNVDQEKVPVISAAAERVAREFSPIHIEVGQTGVFPRPSRPQVLWIGVEDPSGKLLELQQRLENEFAVAGFPKEDRAFRPHLTIARIRKPEGAKHLAQTHSGMQFTNVQLSLNDLILFRSELSSKGSKYTLVSRHRLES